MTVLAPRAEIADALATAIFVLGPKAGLELAEEYDSQALVVDARGRRHLTPQLRGRVDFRGPGGGSAR